jgi:hypothetical protein
MSRAENFFKNIKENLFVDIPFNKYCLLPVFYKSRLLGYKREIFFEKRYLSMKPYTLGYYIRDYIKGSKVPETVEKQFKNILGSTTDMICIPNDYKYNTKLDRLQVLNGILDRNQSCKFKKEDYNQELMFDIMFLAESIGISVEKKYITTTYSDMIEYYKNIPYRTSSSFDNLDDFSTDFINLQDDTEDNDETEYNNDNAIILLENLIDYGDRDNNENKKSKTTVLKKILFDKDYSDTSEETQNYTLLNDFKICIGKNKSSNGIFYYRFTTEKVGIDKYYGFLLDGNHKFLLGNLIVTHNSGKCLKPGTGVMMSDGKIKTVETVEVGEKLMGDDGTPRTVLTTTSGKDTLYKITHNNGDNYTVNSEHVLSLKWNYEKILKDVSSINCFIVSWFDSCNLDMKTKLIRYTENNKLHKFILAKTFLKYVEQNIYVDVPVKTYLELPDYIKSNLVGYYANIIFPSKPLPEPNGDPKLVALNATPNNKPSLTYFINSQKIRRQLLDGFIANPYKNYFSREIRWLQRSLGYHTENCSFKIEKESECGEYYGFELDGNSRFVLENFVVTHNSWLVRDIFYHHRHIPTGVVFSGTEEASPFFGDFIPDCFIHSEYDPELIESIMNKQKKKIREAKMTGKSDTGKLPSNNVFIVLDDMLHDAQNWKKDKTIKNIFFNGRHFNFLFILTMQYPLGITPELRSNIDYVFIFNEPSVKNRKKIYDDYAGMIPSFDHFCNILDACTQNHECLVIKTSGNSTDLRDQIFWYKAESHNNFRVGHPKLWNFHKNNYNENYEEDAENIQEEIDRLKRKFAKTKKLKVIVSRQGDIVDYKQESE